MKTAVTLTVAPATNVKLCALRQTITEKFTRTDLDGVVTTREETREVRRYEFMSAGNVVYTRMPGAIGMDSWQARTREEAKALYRSLVSGADYFNPGAWETCEPVSKLVGEIAMPARRAEFAWGEGANRVAMTGIPAQVCPVVESTYMRKTYTSAFYAVEFATPDGHTALYQDTARVEDGTAKVWGAVA